jgi:ADP-L-glycero-D-manno-heptose 6-epimerase
MHIVTGGAGFIGSAMVWKLNQMGVDDIWIIDTLGSGAKWKNLVGLNFSEVISPEAFMSGVLETDSLPDDARAIIHMGACSATTERDADYLYDNNYNYSRTIAEAALAKGIRLLVASSAATYGGGEHGYDDAPEILPRLRPLNMYGYSKLLFDQWAAKTGALGSLASLRFFNVYGPNEYHKEDMASMVFKTYRVVLETGKLQLFKSHRPDNRDGEQLRDFVYVKDIVDAMWWLLEHPEVNGIFNLGTGVEETWLTLAGAVFAALGKPVDIQFVDMPESIRTQYQYHTKADIARLRQAGYAGEFRPVADGVRDYVVNHLLQDNPFINNDRIG